MAIKTEYKEIIVESYVPIKFTGYHGPVHIRPIPEQEFSPSMHVECSRELAENFPIGTKFRIKVKLTDREGKGKYLYSNYNWKYDVLD